MAETVVVADNVTLLGQNIQSKVGQTLVGATAVANNTKGDSSGPLGVLDTLVDLQRKTIDKITKVFDALQAGVKFEKNEARLVRQEKKEDDLEKKKNKETAFDSILKGELPGESGVSTFLGGFLAGKWGKLLTIAGLLTFFKGIFKVGFLAILGGYIGSMLMTGMVKDEATKNKMTAYLAAGLGLAMFGKTGIAAGLLLVATMGIKSLYDWMSGNKTASQFNAVNWGSMALTGPALMIGARLLTGAKFATLAGLIGGWPFVIAASLAIALAAGIGYVSSEMEKYRTTVLDHLHKITSKSQKEFDDNMANEEENFGTKLFPNVAGAIMGDDYLTDQQNLLLGMEKAQELAEGKGPLEASVAKTVVDATAQMADQTLDKEKFNTMMADEYKMGVMLQTIAHIMKVIETQKLNPEDKLIAQNNLQVLLDHIEAQAKETVKLNKSQNIESPKYIENLAQDDIIEREKTMKPNIDLLTNLIMKQEYDLLKLKDKTEPDIVYNPFGQPVDLGISQNAMEADALQKKLKENKLKLKELESIYKYGAVVKGIRDFSIVNLAFANRDMNKYKATKENILNADRDILNTKKSDRSLTSTIDKLDGSAFFNDNSNTAISSQKGTSVIVYGDSTKVDSNWRSINN